MEIKSVGDLLKNYRKKLKAPQGTVIATFCAVVQKEMGVAIPKESVTYKVPSRTLVVTLAGPLKHEILLHRETLLKQCRQELQNSAPEQII